jgi:hypothetical protein
MQMGGLVPLKSRQLRWSGEKEDVMDKYTINGKVYTETSEQPEATNYGTDGEVRYVSSAVDENGNECEITWETTEEWNLACELETLKVCADKNEDDLKRIAELEAMDLLPPNDESEACDWEHPISVRSVWQMARMSGDTA